MSRYARKPTEIEVTLLDLTDCEGEALKYVRAHAETDRSLGKADVKMPKGMRVGEKWGIVEVGGEVYALCTEGVGPDRPITDEKPLVVDMFVTGYEEDVEGGPVFIEMFPKCSVKLTPEMLRERATGETVGLAEYIRSFGARLDGNYESWRSLLEGAMISA
jgi:hypothetical protein